MLMEPQSLAQVNLCRDKGANWPYFFSLYHKHLEANWKAILSNGEVIYQDDYTADGNAWERLQTYCKQNNLRLEHFMLEYYDNTLNILPPFADGYFFRRGILSEFLCESNGDGFSTPFQGLRSKTFIIGYFKNGLLHSYQVKIPELQVMFDEQIRDKSEQIKTKVFDGHSAFMQVNDG